MTNETGTDTPEVEVIDEPVIENGTLEAERDFLLRSLDDLETERAAGNLDDTQYRLLHDDYTARAAAVLRSLESGADARPAQVKPPVRKRFLVACALVGFAMVAGAILASQLGERSPGQTATGNQQIGDQAEAAAKRLAQLRRDVAQNPQEPGAHLQLGQELLTAGNISEAIQEFDTAAKLDPTDAEASAYGGWVVFLASRAAADSTDPETTADLLEGAMRRLDAAVAADPDYPDAHFFRGMVLLRGRNDPAGAVPEFERYVALVPHGPQTGQVKQLLEAARSQLSGK
jgi:cytochrome c-type biogenesis protein CcmH/NrfG